VTHFASPGVPLDAPDLRVTKILLAYIRATNSDKAIFFLGRKPHRVQCRSLCSSEVTRKIKQLEVEWGTCPSAP